MAFHQSYQHLHSLISETVLQPEAVSRALDAFERALKEVDLSNASVLDERLCTLWNTTVGSSKFADHGRIKAQIRSIAFYGLQSISADSTRLLSMATKAASTWLPWDPEQAENLLHQVADLVPESAPSKLQEATLHFAFLLARLQLAWRMGQEQIADYTFTRIVRLVPLLLARHVETLIYTLFSHAQTLANDHDSADSRQRACKWLQRGFVGTPNLPSNSYLRQSKQTGLQLLARLQLSLDRAESATIERTFASLRAVDASMHSSLLLRRFVFYARHNAPDSLVHAAFQDAARASVVQTKENLSVILACLNSLPKTLKRTKFAFGCELCKLSVAAQHAQTGLVLIAVAIFLEEDSVADFEELVHGCSLVYKIPLEKDAAFAVQSCAWRLADKLAETGKFDTAAKLYLVVTHSPLFDAQASSSNTNCRRKAALMMLHDGRFANADSLLEHPSLDSDASSAYLRFLSACLQNNTARATDQVASMLTCSDFRPALLLRAAQQAYESEMPTLFLFVLEKIAATLEMLDARPDGLNPFLITRCLVRLMAGSSGLKGMPSDPSKFDGVVGQLASIARLLESDQIETSDLENYAADIEWLAAYAHNCAAHGITEKWTAACLVAVLDCASTLLESCIKSSDLRSKAKQTRYTSLAILALEAQKSDSPSSTNQEQGVPLRTRLETLLALLDDPSDHSMRSQAMQMAVSFYLLRHDWTSASKICIQAAGAVSVDVPLLTSLAYLVCSNPEIPTSDLCAILQAIIQAEMDADQLDTQSFARWLRAMLETTQARGAFLTSLELAKNAERLLSVNAKEYPQEEIEWLLATAWDMATTSYTQHADEAEAWFQVAFKLVCFSSHRVQLEPELRAYYTSLASTPTQS